MEYCCPLIIQGRVGGVGGGGTCDFPRKCDISTASTVMIFVPTNLFIGDCAHKIGFFKVLKLTFTILVLSGWISITYYNYNYFFDIHFYPVTIFRITERGLGQHSVLNLYPYVYDLVHCILCV